MATFSFVMKDDWCLWYHKACKAFEASPLLALYILNPDFARYGQKNFFIQCAAKFSILLLKHLRVELFEFFYEV